jgi:hypothetical protein
MTLTRRSWRGTCSIWHRSERRRTSLLPPTGSSGLPWRWRFRPQVHAGRVRHPDGQTDRRPRRRGRAVGTPAGTIRMPPVSRSGSRAVDGHQSRIIQRARTRRARARECRGGTGCRSPGRQRAGRCGRPDRPSSYSGITLSDEGGLKRTHADPPICRQVSAGRHAIRAAPERLLGHRGGRRTGQAALCYGKSSVLKPGCCEIAGS